MSTNVKNLIKSLVDFENILEEKATKLRELGLFKKVEVTSGFINYLGCSSISSSLNADLLKPINNDLHCLSFSCTFFLNKKNMWEIHAELGWSSYDEGFVDYKMLEEEYEELGEMLKSMNLLTENTMKDVDVLVDYLITHQKEE